MNVDQYTHIYAYIYIYKDTYINTHTQVYTYGVATMSRRLKMKGLFCRLSSLL